MGRRLHRNFSTPAREIEDRSGRISIMYEARALNPKSDTLIQTAAHSFRFLCNAGAVYDRRQNDFSARRCADLDHVRATYQER